MTTESERITPLLAGMDTVYFSCDLPLSEAMRDRLTQEKTIAQVCAAQRQVHCPEWLEARIAPQGAKGGYAFLIETEDFSVKLLGVHIQTSIALMTLQRWMERIAEKEVERITAKCRRYQEQGRQAPKWVRAGLDERF